MSGLSLFPVFCWAESPTLRQVTSVQAAGMGGATRGFAEGIDAVLVNPAAIAASPRFSLSAEYVVERNYNRSLLSGCAVDSRINAEDNFNLSGGLFYSYYQSGSGNQAQKGSLLGVALSSPLYPHLIFAGITAKYFNLSGATKSSAVTADAAIMIRPLSPIGISAIGYNLIDIKNPEAQRSWGFGLALGEKGSFHIDIDLHLEKSSQDKYVMGYEAGAEYSIKDFFIPRIGYCDDRLQKNRLISGGFSLVYSGLAFDLSYQQALQGAARRFGFALRIVDWAM